MKQNWETEELIDDWTLLPNEQTMLANKTGATRLGFALLLKFFALENRFPRSNAEIPSIVIEFVDKQVRVAPELFSEYRLRGRTASYHRTQIRELCGFREASLVDAERLADWLQKEILSAAEFEAERLLPLILRQCREWKIEPFSAERLERIIASARRGYEESFCQKIHLRLSPETADLLDKLLLPGKETNPPDGLAAVVADNNNSGGGDDSKNENTEQISMADWRVLKAAPGRANAESLLTEIKRLKLCRRFALPADLFSDVPRKILLGLRRRAVIEEPFELRRHSPALRQTLLAAFCFVRMGEIIDILVDLLIEVIHHLNLKAERRVEREMFAELSVSAANKICCTELPKPRSNIPKNRLERLFIRLSRNKPYAIWSKNGNLLATASISKK